MTTESKYLHTLVNNIKHILSERGLTDADLARLTGISKSYISDLLREEGNPSLEKLELIEKGLGISVPNMLKSLDSGEITNINIASVDDLAANLPEDYKVITAILSGFQAYRVRRWHKENCKKIAEPEELEGQ